MTEGIAGVVQQLQQRLDDVPADLQHRRVFLATYLRTTQAVGTAITQGRFEDPDWVEEWDVKFAELYLDAHDAAEGAARPWRLAFEAPADLPPLLHVLLGVNAHVNYDLPQALLAVISDEDFADPQLMERRRRDHERIDGVLAERVSAEDNELGGARSLLDRVLTPLNRRASQRFLRESRQKVWHNTAELQRARLDGPAAYATRLAELELLSAAKIADLLRPGQVLLRLAITGFGVTLPPPA
ncbi:DUF5995 family protein [Kribbella sp. CA-247076]|uniref:DUF5995 family protein n=1 Tax=Kribbella sp. CA-247076 TaxID=3239941 RepID=UPI003D8BB6DC